MPFINKKVKEVCLGCKGMRGHWLPPIHYPDHPEESIPTTWIDCGICNGDGYVMISRPVYITQEELDKQHE